METGEQDSVDQEKALLKIQIKQGFEAGEESALINREGKAILGAEST